MSSGEEVAIKLVRLHFKCCSVRPACPAMPWLAIRLFLCAHHQLLTPLCTPLPLGLQETCKTKHPQLLYESKLYKILQGGGELLVILSRTVAAP